MSSSSGRVELHSAEEILLGEKPLGRGSYAVVYPGKIIADGTPVAVKVINLDNVGDDLDEIQKEIRAMWDLQNSPHVTKVFGSFVVDDNLWIVMEFLGGGCIQDLRNRKELPEEAIAIILKETLLGLEYLHSQNKIHRDIKAANILLTSDAQVKLADFGVSAQLSDSIKKRHTLIGSPFWMAPEVFMGSGHNEKVDVWSVGITAIEIATQHPPYYRENPVSVAMKIPMQPAPRLEGGYSTEFKDFVQQALTKDPDLRPSVSELLDHPFLQGVGDCTRLKELIGDSMDIQSVGDISTGNTLRREAVKEKDSDWAF